MSSLSPIGRRRFLIVAGGGVLAIAGCTKDATRSSPAATNDPTVPSPPACPRPSNIATAWSFAQALSTNQATQRP